MGTLGEAMGLTLSTSPALRKSSFRIFHLFIQPCPLVAHPISPPGSFMLNLVWGWHRCSWGPKTWEKARGIADKRCSCSVPVDGQWSHLTCMCYSFPVLVVPLTHSPRGWSMFSLFYCPYYHPAKLHSMPVSLNHQSCCLTLAITALSKLLWGGVSKSE